MEKEDLEVPCETSGPRIVELEFYVDDRRWKESQEKYGKSPLADINKEINQLLEDASLHLAKLDKGGYKLHLHKPVEQLKNSEIKLGSTYRDRRNDNKTMDLDKTDILGYAFTLQEAVSEMLSKGWKTPPNILRFILASGYQNCSTGEVCPVGGVSTKAAAEEYCLCNPDTFPCVGVFTQTSNSVPDSVLLAHEIGHTLGVYPHDEQPGYIMSDPIRDRDEYVWSEWSKGMVNAQNNSCLEMQVVGVQ